MKRTLFQHNWGEEGNSKLHSIAGLTNVRLFKYFLGTSLNNNQCMENIQGLVAMAVYNMNTAL